MLQKKILSILAIVFLLSVNIKAQVTSQVTDLNPPNSLVNFLSISFDSEQMLYASKLKNEPSYSFFILEKGANGWRAPERLVEINNLISPETKIGGACFNYNAEKIYFSLDVNQGTGTDIFYIEKLNNQWLPAKKLDTLINSKGNESDPSVSADGNSLYFVRDNVIENEFSGDFDCKTILVSELQDNGKWGKPYRMPGQINSGCVSSPKISADNKTLYFSAVKNDESGFDIYHTVMIAKGIWSDPEKLTNINNEFSNIYPNINFSGDNVFCINQYKKGTKKESALVYKSELEKKFKPEFNMILKGKVTDLYSDEAVKAEIKIINPFTSKVISTYNSNSKTGNYFFFLNSNKSYRIDFTAPGYSHKILTYNIEILDSNIVKQENIKLYSSASLILNVFDKENFQPLNADLKLYNAQTNNEISPETNQISKGRFKIDLPLGKEYKIIASMKNYVPDTLIFDIRKVVQFDEFEKDIELAVLKREFVFNIKDGGNNIPVSADIIIENKSRDERIVLKAGQSKNGRYKVQLREGDEYVYNVVASKGYAFRTGALDLKKEKSGQMDVELLALKANSKLQLNNIIFETNSAELTAVSFEELDRVVELLRKNPNLKIEISAHTDNVGSDAYNLKLSDKRAQSVVDYLTDKGISKRNLEAKGYGESNPIAPNDTDENKAKNRRVELNILEETVQTE